MHKSMFDKSQILFWAMLLVYSLIHYCLWAAYPPDVDPINFVTALHNYDLAIDSPHPPGYPLFVGLGRLYAFYFYDRHAYQAVNLTLTLVAAIGLSYLIRRQSSWNMAILGTCLFIFSPLLLSATTVQESYVSDAVFGVAILSWITANHSRPIRLLIGVIALFTMFGLIRLVSTALMAPLCLVAAYRMASTERLKLSLKCGVALSFGAVIAWIITVHLAGGIETYSAASNRVMGAAVRANSMIAGAPWQSHLTMVVKLYGWLGYLIAPIAVTWAIATWLGTNSRGKSTNTCVDAWIYTAWIFPPLAFYTFIYFLKPTYLLIFLPPAILLTIELINKSVYWERSRHPIVLVCAVAFGLLLMYLVPDYRWPKPIYRHSYSFVTDSDRTWRQLVQGVESCNAGPSNLLIWQPPLPLPVYAVRLLQWQGQAAAIDIVSKARHYFKPDSLVWFTPTSLEVAVNAEKEVIISGTNHSLYVQCPVVR